MVSRLAIVVGVLCVGVTPCFAAMTQTDCQALWTKADKDGDGILAAAEAQMYAEAIAGTDQKLKDPTAQKIEQEEFLKACQTGAFDKLKAD
jgi:hypothetical protein